MQLFPHKLKDYNLFLTINYNDIKAIIAKNIKDFFSLYEKFTDSNCNKEISSPSPFNQIFKKILLETNNKNLSEVKVNTGIDEKQSLILLLSDCVSNEQLHYDQKLLYLIKKNKILFDCVHIGEHRAEYNSKFESVALYCGGLFLNVPVNNETNLTQVLLQVFLPLPGDRKKRHANISGLNVTEEQLICDKCGRVEPNQPFCFIPAKNMVECQYCFKQRNAEENSSLHTRLSSGSLNNGNRNNSNLNSNNSK